MTLVVQEYEEIKADPDEENTNAGPRRVTKVGTFHVEKNKLAEASPYFESLVRKSWAEASQSTVTLKGDNVKAMEIWLRLFHATLEQIALASVTLKVIWYAVMASDRYGIDREKLSDWFALWFDAKRFHDKTEYCHEFAPRALFPCFAFDYAPGFQRITRALAYNWPYYIHELNPTTERKMHVPSRVIQHLNAAKGRLRNILHRELIESVCKIVDHGQCDCKERTVFDFLKELRRIKVWPLEEVMAKASTEMVLGRLSEFDSARMNLSGTGTDTRHCRCSVDWSQVVSHAVLQVRNYFDGLCLDCMKSTKGAKFRRDEDFDYWDHYVPRTRYDTWCRIDHGEPTWYFSFMGRREKPGLIADA